MADPLIVVSPPTEPESEAEEGGAPAPSEGPTLQEALAILRLEGEAQAARIRALQEEVERLQRELGQALQRYRQAVLEASSDLPPDLLTGETVAELDASAVRARALVERVRSQVEAQLARGRVPAGAPPRRAPDFSTLSARDKIALGLERR